MEENRRFSTTTFPKETFHVRSTFHSTQVEFHVRSTFHCIRTFFRPNTFCSPYLLGRYFVLIYFKLEWAKYSPYLLGRYFVLIYFKLVWAKYSPYLLGRFFVLRKIHCYKNSMEGNRRFSTTTFPKETFHVRSTFHSTQVEFHVRSTFHCIRTFFRPNTFRVNMG